MFSFLRKQFERNSIASESIYLLLRTRFIDSANLIKLIFYWDLSSAKTLVLTYISHLSSLSYDEVFMVPHRTNIICETVNSSRRIIIRSVYHMCPQRRQFCSPFSSLSNCYSILSLLSLEKWLFVCAWMIDLRIVEPPLKILLHRQNGCVSKYILSFKIVIIVIVISVTQDSGKNF